MNEIPKRIGWWLTREERDEGIYELWECFDKDHPPVFTPNDAEDWFVCHSPNPSPSTPSLCTDFDPDMLEELIPGFVHLEKGECKFIESFDDLRKKE